MTPDRELLRSVRAEFDSFDLGAWLLMLVAFVPYALGWLAGFIVQMVLWLIAAMVAGYKAGRGIGDE